MIVRTTIQNEEEMAHTLVEGHHLKNNRGDSHSRKKRAAPVDAWPVSNPSRGGHYIKNGKDRFSPRLSVREHLLWRFHILWILSCFDPREPNPTQDGFPPLT